MHSLVVHPGNVQDRDGATLVLTTVIGLLPRLATIWADVGDGGQLRDWVRGTTG